MEDLKVNKIYRHDSRPLHEQYAEDIQLLRNFIPRLENLSNKDIGQLYQEYSQEMCASWLILHDNGERFARWLYAQYSKFKFMGT